MSVIEDKLKLLPNDPGVYVMLGQEGQVIYVGKAKNLKNRVRQYFQAGAKPDKVLAMVKNIADFYYIIVPSEIDALSLENNLIKKYKPRYNILLKDDKTYPYLKINLKEDFPTFRITRRIKRDGAKYFGPYMGGISVNSLLDTLNLLYSVRPCDKALTEGKVLKPCLNYHLKKCLAPCAGGVSRTEYLERIKAGVEFLSGDIAPAEKILKERMLAAAENQDFELALKYKESLAGLDKLKLKRVTAINRPLNADIIAFAANGIYSAANLLIVRGGRMLGSKNFSFESAALSASDAISEFILRYYKEGADIPAEIISAAPLADSEVLEEYFKTVLGRSVAVHTAKQGVRRQLADMAEVNAGEHLSVAVDKIKHKDDMTVAACRSLQEKLGLKNYPHRMECYDISNISGVDKVGSMVVFTEGEADRDEYRRFKIKTFEGADDFRSLQEVLRRRFARMATDPDKFPKPDLMVIDGGKGQLSAVGEIFREENIEGIDLISLAKREEEIFLPGKSDPVVLSKSDYCLKMLQRIRDEAHRFAITYHRTLRGKRSLASVLDGVKGLGKLKKHALMERFRDLGGIINATKEELMQVEGIGEVQADRIMEKLNSEGLRHQ